MRPHGYCDGAGARQTFWRQEQSTGALEVGKQADLLVLDKNIFERPTAQVSKAKVLWTLLGGVETYRDADF